MKYVLGLIVLIVICMSCKKDNDPVAPPVVPPVAPPVVPPVTNLDSLAQGWSLDTSLHDSFSDIFFTNQTGYAVSYNIYKSTDGGVSWHKKYATARNFFNIAMWGDADALFATQEDGGKIIITHDGGNNFDSVVLGDNKLTDIFFTGPKTVYAVGLYFWRSDDAGDHWTKIYDFNQPAFGENYKSLFFLNEQTGWIAGAHGVFKTINGGISWVLQNTPEFSYNLYNGNLASVFFSDSLHGLITDLHFVGVTFDSGTNWSKTLPLQDGYHDIHLVNSDTGYVSDNQYIWKTIDAGSTWTKEAKIYNKRLVELHFTDSHHGWACGSGIIMRFSK